MLEGNIYKNIINVKVGIKCWNINYRFNIGINLISRIIVLIIEVLDYDIKDS